MRVLLLALVLVPGCAREGIGSAALEDPAACAGCHPVQYDEWSRSAHAYASDDPVFAAMERRGQRETAGALGSFCLGCHSPMAVRSSGITAASELGDAPRSQRGVTCYFCHEASAVHGDHDAPIELAGDDLMRGGFAHAEANPAHGSTRSELLDGRSPASASLCGSCHDVVTPAGVRVESTYAEWQASVYAGGGAGGLSCSGCHMMGRDGAAAAGDNLPTRRIHDHSFPGLDVPLSTWPGGDALRAGIARDLGASISSKLCVLPAGVEVTLDNVLAGHGWPSGVTHARRAWVELIARRGGEVVYQSGVVEPGEDPSEDAGGLDPDRWVLRARFLDAAGHDVDMAWQAASVESRTLPTATTRDPSDPRFYHAMTRAFHPPRDADELELHVRTSPLGASVVRSLEVSGDLAPGLAATVPVFEIAGATHTWRVADGYGCVPR
jgi:hypothetical protein